MRYWTSGLVAGAACVACCAPLFAPLFAGTALVGVGAAGASFFKSIELGIIVTAVVLAGLYLYWRHYQSVQLASAQCGCAPDSGCNTGDACDVPKLDPNKGPSK